MSAKTPSELKARANAVFCADRLLGSTIGGFIIDIPGFPEVPYNEFSPSPKERETLLKNEAELNAAYSAYHTAFGTKNELLIELSIEKLHTARLDNAETLIKFFTTNKRAKLEQFVDKFKEAAQSRDCKNDMKDFTTLPEVIQVLEERGCKLVNKVIKQAKKDLNL